MKIKAEHYQTIREVIKWTLKQYRHSMKSWMSYYSDNCIGSDHDMRARWDLFKIAVNMYLYDSFIVDKLYPYLNDRHIDTALRRIVKELTGE